MEAAHTAGADIRPLTMVSPMRYHLQELENKEKGVNAL